MREINITIKYIIQVPDAYSVEDVAKDTVEDVYKHGNFWQFGREMEVKAEHASYPFERCTIRSAAGASLKEIQEKKRKERGELF